MINSLRIVRTGFLLLVNLSVISQVFGFISQDWQEVERSAQSAVVQIFAQKAKFNWLEPYKSPEQIQGSGTAFFINAEGYLLTNFHVIDQSKSIFLNVPALGRRPIEAAVVGVCPDSDLALIRMCPEGRKLVEAVHGSIPFLTLGDSDALYKTKPVMALGYPFGERYMKSTVGVIAGREYIDGRSFMHITAPINPGNSGGPLLILEGEVVGINSAGIPGAQNIGYIIPINDVKIVLEDLMKDLDNNSDTVKFYRKPQIGVGTNHTTEEHAASLKNPVPGGLFINYVESQSVAGKAGVKAGDMLYSISFQGQTYDIDEYGDVTVKWRSSDKVTLGELLIRLPVNEPLNLRLYRSGQAIEISCNFTAAPKYPIRFIYPDYEIEEIDYEMFGGAVIMQLRDNHFNILPPTSLLRQYARVDHQEREILIITCILPGSQMHKVECFYPGSLIDKVNGHTVKNLKDLRETLLSSVETREIAITTKDNFSTVVSLDKILNDEFRISRNFMFPITDMVKKLMTLSQQKKN